MIFTVHVAKRLAWFPIESYIPVSSCVRRIFFSTNKLTERSLKYACHSVDWMVTEWWRKYNWNPPFPSQFSRHLATIQSPFSQLKGEISSCVWILHNLNWFCAIKIMRITGCSVTGVYGSNCSIPCPDSHCRYCHPETGTCQGCEPGYRGHHCELGNSNHFNYNRSRYLVY